MMKIRRIPSLFLACVMLCLIPIGLVSCGKKAFTDEEAVSIITGLLERDSEMNAFIWGEGIGTEHDPENHVNDTTFYYMEVARTSVYTTLDELRRAVDDLYSKDVKEIIDRYAFEKSSEDSAIIPRYSENGSGVLQIDVANEGFELSVKAYPENAEVVRATEERIEVRIRISSDGENFREKSIAAVFEDGKWKLDTQTWCVGVVG